MSALIQDLRFLGRMVRRSPGFYLLVIVTLGLGVGANLATFTVANGVLFSPLPFHEPQHLTSIWESNLEEEKNHERVAPPNFADYLEIFDGAAAWWAFDVNLTDATDGDPLRISTVECTANLFSVLGVAPALGPGFDEGELFSPDLAAVISHRLWQQRYAGDPAIIGQLVTLNGNAYTITGVMPPTFQFPRPDVEIWQRQSWPFTRRTRYAHFMEAVGRLPASTTLGQAQTRLTTISERLAEEHPESNGDWRARLVPLQDEIVGEYRAALNVLLGAVALLLLLAGINVANLMLARARLRQREMAIRAAVGASPNRLLRLTVTESLVLGIGGTFFGAALAVVVVRLLVTAPPLPIPRLSAISFNAEIVLFAIALTIVATAVFALLPALRVLRTGFRPLLEGHGGAGHRRSRRLLVVVETALAMTLLIGAGLMIRSVHALLAIDPGFTPGRTVTVTLELPATLYPDWPRVSQLYHQLLEHLADHPAIDKAGATAFLPLSPGWIVGYTVPDRPPRHDGETLRAQYVTTSEGYFETLRVPLLFGRTFTAHDTADSPPVVVINEEMARRTWTDPEKAIGQHLKAGTSGFGPLGRSFAPTDVYEVVGVVADVKNNGLESPPDPAIYFTVRQFPYRTMAIVARGDASVPQLATAIRDAVHQVDPMLPMTAVRTPSSVLADATARPRFVMSLLIGFAVLAIVLAAIGVFGVLSYTVAERRKEIAIRSCIGASPTNVRSQVLREGMTLAGLGAGVGILLAFTLSRFMSAVLFEISSADPKTFLLALLTVAASSLAAAALPAHRAARANLIDSLRVE